MISGRSVNSPSVGVFLSQGAVSSLKRQKVNGYKIKQLVEANRIANTNLFFFSVSSVDFNRSVIRGVYFDDKKNVWAEKNFPFPDVLYDRVKGVKTLKMTGDEVRQRFDSLGIRKINSRAFFDKWELYRVLQADKNLRKHLPLTKEYRTVADLDEMLGSYNKIYLKGCTGSRGKQVMCITKLPDGTYTCKYFLESVIVSTANDLAQLSKIIDDFFSGKHNIIVQQAIELLSMNGCIIDFRGELQRNGEGELTVTAIPVRVGKNNSPISTRGTSYPFEEFFRDILNYPKEEITLLRSRVESLLFNIYMYMEKTYGPFGELGIDIGLDNEGLLWFFECNSKSAKESLCNTARGETLQKAFLNPLQYAGYISRRSFSLNQPAKTYSYPGESRQTR